jgi:hypothetical protein
MMCDVMRKVVPSSEFTMHGVIADVVQYSVQEVNDTILTSMVMQSHLIDRFYIIALHVGNMEELNKQARKLMKVMYLVNVIQ